MSYNVPTDWDHYYNDCTLCGGRYHASDGGCGCVEEECECGGCWFERRDEEIVCTECETGPWCEQSTTITEHVAEKDRPDIGIKAGQIFQRAVTLGFYPNGKLTHDVVVYSTQAKWHI